MVQWLRLCAANAGDAGWIPGWGSKIQHAIKCSQRLKKQIKKKRQKITSVDEDVEKRELS